MRDIKFRGKDIDTGNYVYAELGEVSAEINPEYLTFITDEGMYVVETNSIEQLIGVDKNGNEIYEGDKVIRKWLWSDELRRYVAVVDSRPVRCEFDDYRAILDGEIVKFDTPNA